MPSFNKTYSRGNDDPQERIYETAKIMVNLRVDTDKCKDENGKCNGDISVSLDYVASRSTQDPNRDFERIGPNFVLRDEGQTVNTSRLNFSNTNPGGNIGDTLRASLALGTIPCSGGKIVGIVSVEAMTRAGYFPGLVQERFDYEVTIGRCGKIIETKLEGFQLNPAIIRNRIRTDFIDITDGANGYPAYPGVPR